MYCIYGPIVFQLPIRQNPKTNCMYCLYVPKISQLCIFHNHNKKIYVLHKWSNCLPAVYMSESEQ